MSEFSDSFHLRAGSRLAAVDLLQRAGRAGYVFPAIDGWVTFVAEGDASRPNGAVARANTGTLLRWWFADDHGWGFTVQAGRKLLIDYGCSWDDDEVQVTGAVDQAQLEAALDMPLPALSGLACAALLRPRGIEDLIGTRPAHTFAAALGLTHHRWLSFDYLQLDASRGHPLPAGVKAVGVA